MRYSRLTDDHGQGGQSIIEAALLLPFLIIILFNTINLGYFFFAGLNLTTAPRQGAEYSIQGFASGLQAGAPAASVVQTLVDQGIIGAIPAANGITQYQVCTPTILVGGIGVQNQGTTNQIPNCAQYNSAPSAAPHPDPEAPLLILNRVDIWYQVSPIIPGALFNLFPTPNIHRYVEMRLIN
jgi:hypothetical protein